MLVGRLKLGGELQLLDDKYLLTNTIKLVRIPMDFVCVSVLHASPDRRWHLIARETAIDSAVVRGPGHPCTLVESLYALESHFCGWWPRHHDSDALFRQALFRKSLLVFALS